MQQKRNQQAEIRLGSHGEDYGSWMSNPVFYIIGGITALAVVLAILSFSVFHITALGVLLSVVTAALVALLAVAGSWNRFTGSFSLTWTMTDRAVSWRSDAVPGPCRSVRP